MARTFYAIFLIVAYNLVRQMKESHSSFLLLVLFVSALLVNFRLFEKIFYFIQQDIRSYSLDKLDLIKRLLLVLFWAVAIFVARKGGEPGWLFEVIDEATLIFLIMLGLLILLNISSATSVLMSILAISYAAFFSIFKYTKNEEVFAILAFFLFTWSVIKAFKEQLNNI